MAAIKDWISAARLRTLPLAFSSVLMGSALAAEADLFRWEIFLLALLTTLFLQVLSNFANDYGDTINGADNSDRVGPMRAVQRGAISTNEMRKGIAVCGLAALLSGVALLYFSGIKTLVFMILLTVGLLAILAAIKYTAGKNPYGYKAMGDFFVFVFFGLVAVLGTYYLHGTSLPSKSHVLVASSIGFLSVAVLNLNNMRDATPDKAAGKITMAVLMGFKTAKIYQAILISTALISLFYYASIDTFSAQKLLFGIMLIPLARHLVTVFKCQQAAQLDSQLKLVALSTFFISILFGLGLVL